MIRTIIGLSFGFHDAGVSVVDYDTGEILFASHAERYSKIKNDPWINHEIIAEALSFGNPKIIALNENPYLKKWRQLLSGDFNEVLYVPAPARWLKYYPELSGIPIKHYGHHESHAAAGLFCMGDNLFPGWSESYRLGAECAVMVVDAIGELDTASIWKYSGLSGLSKISSIKYPNSLGLFYSAMTDYIGLKPMEDEYILMGMAAYGNQDQAVKITKHLDKRYFKDCDKNPMKARINLHRGIPNDPFLDDCDHFDIALATQMEFERRLLRYAQDARKIHSNLVYMGGCALNCVANQKLAEMFNHVQIMPNPGDSGSSLGAAALAYREHVPRGMLGGWTPYLGHNIPGKYPVKKILGCLTAGEIVGVANGRAEFGPRALGNRSLFANPKDPLIKDKVNRIKQRQEFRPFAPVVLAREAHHEFEMPRIAEFNVREYAYMQRAVKCKNPKKYPAICHEDGTSRVQVVTKELHPELFAVLTEWNNLTGCPMLLNTSLNIKGMPIVNDERDARVFQQEYDVPVFTSD